MKELEQRVAKILSFSSVNPLQSWYLFRADTKSLVCSTSLHRRITSKLRFAESRAQVGIIQFCLNLWKSLSNFVRHCKPLCMWSNVLQSLKVLLLVWCSAYLQNHYTKRILWVWRSELTGNKAVPLNGDTLHQQIYLTAFKSSKKKKKKFPCHMSITNYSGLPVRRCSCTIEATMWQLDISESTARWCCIMCMFHLCHRHPEQLTALIKRCRGTDSEAEWDISCVRRESCTKFTNILPQFVSVSASREKKNPQTSG